MDKEELSDAIFGLFDGVVSVVGFVFGLLIHGSGGPVIAVGALGGAISATVSMATGDYQSATGAVKLKLRRAAVMGVATFLGSMAPTWPFFFFSRTVALLVAALCCLAVGGWIAYEKHQGWRGVLSTYATLIMACGLSLAVVAAIPASVGG